MTAALIDLADRRRARPSIAPRPGRPEPLGDARAQVVLTEAELRAAVESLRRTIRLQSAVAGR